MSFVGFARGVPWVTVLAWQRIVYDRPPALPFRRGLVALPPMPTVVVVVTLLVVLLSWALRRRFPRR